jgi:hypothetical protein
MEEPRYPIETFRQLAVQEGIVSPEVAAEIDYVPCPHCAILTLCVPDVIFEMEDGDQKVAALVNLLHLIQYENKSVN